MGGRRCDRGSYDGRVMMRILAIRGARLASLDAPFEIDLSAEPLRSAGVFAIVGPTGAGKSSILDALCLALFDTTPRLARAPRQHLHDDDDDPSARDARTLVRRGAKDAFAEVDFVGVDGRTHRARWSVERARTGKLRGAQLSVRELPGGRVVAGTKTEVLAAIESRLGLGFGELRRAVVLPQGEIAAFLDAPEGDRALLLERLTGAEIFAEVAKVIHQRASDARRRCEMAEAPLRMLDVLDVAEIAKLEAQVIASRLAAVRAEERVASLAARRDGLAVRARLMAEERDAHDAFADVERQRALAELDRGNVDLAERVDVVREPLEAAVRAQRQEAEGATRLARERGSLADAEASLEPLERAFAHETEQLRVLSAVHDERRRQRESERAALVDRAREVSLSSRSLGDASSIHARQEALTFVARSLERIEAARAAAERASKAAERADTELRSNQDALSGLTVRTREVELDAGALAIQVGEATRAHERALTARSLADHRGALVPGEACPLCGATEHALALSESLASLASESSARVATLTLALERTRATHARIDTMRAACEREARGAIVRRSDALAARVEAEGDAELARIEAVERATFVESRLGSAIERGLDTARGVLAECRADVLAHADAIDRARSKDREAHEMLASHDASAREEEARAHAAATAATSRVEQASRARAGVVERGHLLRANLQRIADAVAAARSTRETADLAASLALARAALTPDDAPRALAFDPERVRRSRADLARLDRERASARARLDERTARRVEAEDALAAEGPTGESLDAAIDRLRAERDVARHGEMRADALLAHDGAARARAVELGESLELARIEERRWTGLDSLVGAADGKRFREHAQSITLERLVAYANAELANLAPRFLLARAPSAGELALAVVDREAGHARRSVQSLSGGESFLVSLALALGLAAMTAAEGGRGTLRASSLFLDEGLGALDPDSLEIALGALDALRASGRQIAIVTHVPAVAERFAARIEVVPRGAGRSDVRVMRA